MISSNELSVQVQSTSRPYSNKDTPGCDMAFINNDPVYTETFRKLAENFWKRSCLGAEQDIDVHKVDDT